MEEETQDQSVNDVEAQETPSVAEPVEETPQEAEETVEEQPSELSEVDERGVPWKNRAMEYERKYIEALERQSKPAPAAPSQNEPEETDEVGKVIKPYLDKYLQRVQHQEKLKTAFDYITEKGLTVAEVDKVAAEFGLSNADPLRMVKNVEKILKARKPQEAPRKVVNKDVEKKRIEKIKKTTTEAGSKPAEARPKESAAHLAKFKSTGDKKDLAAYFRAKLDEK